MGRGDVPSRPPTLEYRCATSSPVPISGAVAELNTMMPLFVRIPRTDLVKQVPSGGKLEEDIDSRYVVALIRGIHG